MYTQASSLSERSDDTADRQTAMRGVRRPGQFVNQISQRTTSHFSCITTDRFQRRRRHYDVSESWTDLGRFNWLSSVPVLSASARDV